jgi:hypothetical protein
MNPFKLASSVSKYHHQSIRRRRNFPLRQPARRYQRRRRLVL